MFEDYTNPMAKAIPVMVGSDEWSGHWQAIIGYDDICTINRTEDDIITAFPTSQ